MSEQSDSELIFLARHGNKAAFGRLVLRYQPMALRIAKRMIGNEDFAQELVQDAMLQTVPTSVLRRWRIPRRMVYVARCFDK